MVRPRGRSYRDERGAVAVFMAAVISVLVVVAALVVDIGMQRVARTDMQTLADVVALDLSRELDGRTDGVIDDTVQALANASRDRQVKLNSDQDEVRSALGSLPQVTPVLGKLDTAGAFQPTGDGEVPNAVQVTATTTVAFAFGVASSGSAMGEAVGTAQAGGCFSIGSFALGLNSSQSILRSVLGNTAALRVLSYGGVLTPRVSLLGVATELGLATPESLLTLPGLTVGEFLLASSEVLGKRGDATAEAFLAGLEVDLGPLADRPINLAQLVQVGQGGASALNADLDVLGLVGGGLFLANGASAIGLNLGLPGVTNVSLNVLQRPQIACNDGVARTSQVSIVATLNVLGLIKVRLRVGLAEGRGRLAGVNCVNGAPNSISVSVFDQSLASVKVNVSVLSSDPADPVISPDSIPQQPPYGLPLDASYETPVTTDGGDIGLSNTALNASILGLPLVTRLALAPVTAVVFGLVDGLLTDLLGVLGVDAAGADLLAIRTPSCVNPRLAG